MATPWSDVSAAIERLLGLHYPRERLADLRRGLKGAAAELGLSGADEVARLVLSPEPDPARIEVVATHLTIGETYFFRGEDTFAALADRILPDLIAERRRQGDLSLRVWSAACCTGEEAYSLAIVLHQLLPDIGDWNVTVLGTDINPHFLRKARDAVYSQWSFRGTRESIRSRYFQPAPGGRLALRPGIRRMVTFAKLNLIEGVGTAALHGPFDLVFCRNVLMYFTPEQAARVIDTLHAATGEQGWLAVAPCEASRLGGTAFELVQFENAILHRRRPDRPVRTAKPPRLQVVPHAPCPPAPTPLPRIRLAPRVRLAATGAVAPVRPAPAAPPPAARVASLEDARSLANQRRMPEALACCDRYLARHKLDADAHYLRGVVLAETGQLDAACEALERCMYLAPDHAMAGYALAGLELSRGRGPQATRHCRHLLEVLSRMPAGSAVAHAEGVNVGQMSALASDLLRRIGGTAA